MLDHVLLLIVLAALSAGLLWRSPLLRVIVLDTLRHPNRPARYIEEDDGTVVIVPTADAPSWLAVTAGATIATTSFAIGGVSYSATAITHANPVVQTFPVGRVTR